MKIVFIAQTLSQPRVHKRIESFINNGYEVEIFSFDRGWYSVNTKLLKWDYTILAKYPDGHYFKRLLILYKHLMRLFKRKSKENILYYSMGFDNTLFTAFFSHKHFMYEIPDIMYLGLNKISIPFFKWLDKIIMRKSLCTILTSEGFKDYLLNGKDNDEGIDTVVLPNKVNPNLMENGRPVKEQCNINRIRFAFIGLLRYPETIFSFIHVLDKVNKSRSQNHEFHFYGDGKLKDKVIEVSQKYDNVFFHGPFKSPIDLPSIYSKVDINFVCYDTKTMNERIAEPNKYYESIFFKTPLLVSPGTFLAKNVLNNKVGLTLNAKDEAEVLQFFEILSVDKLVKMSHSAADIPAQEIINSDMALFNFLDKKGIKNYTC